MDLVFDIAEDELQVFLAEADEHLQTLDEGLVRLERQGDDPELLPAIFRAAHTLKGSAGAIGHRRMADLTHAMETALDGLRKQTLSVSLPLVDACLEALDALKLLRNEVADGEASLVDVAPLVERLSEYGAPRLPAPPADGREMPAPAQARADGARPKARPGATRSARKRRRPREQTADRRARAGPRPPAANASSTGRRKPTRRAARSQTRQAQAAPGIPIRVEIAADSAASAARAFQIMLALQSLGQVHDLQPPPSVIETAAPVRQVTARLVTGRSAQAIRDALAAISEIERLVIGEAESPFREEIQFAGAAPVERSDGEAPPARQPPAAPADESALRLGEFLVRRGYITPAQLEAAVQAQSGHGDGRHLLGQTLVQMGALSQERLDSAVAEQIQQLRSALQTAQPAAARSRPRPADKTVRTSVERLDNLMNLAGELITERNRLFQIRSDFETRLRGDDRLENLAQTTAHIGRITDQLQEEVMRTRLLPIANVFSKYPRLVRDLARKAGKEVELIIRGEDTELDRSVIEEIGDPLIHLLRNAVDHGLETPGERAAAGKPECGAILLTARHEESRIIVSVEDDGRGIDAERVKASAVERGLLTAAEAAALSHEEVVDLIFRPGLSTAKVVSDLSGRGVGLDIVRANIARLNGTVAVETWAGKGARFQIMLPLTLAIIPSLLVRVGAGVFALPLVAVMETLRARAADIHTIKGRPVTLLRQRVLPLVRLSGALGFSQRANGRRHEFVVVVRWGKLEMGLMVDALVGGQEVVIKPLGAPVGQAPGVSGAAILGDGSVALIVDVPALFKLAGV